MDKRIYLLAAINFVMGLVEMAPAGILPNIAKDLDIPLAAAGQLLGLFSLAFAVAAPVLQVLTARFERKRVLLWSLAGFSLATLWGAFAPSFAMQLTARVLQASAGGLMCGTLFGFAHHIATPVYRGRAIALVMMGISSAIVLGVPLGIQLAEWAGWRSLFALSVALALPAMLAAWAWLPSVPGKASVPLRMQLHTLRDLKLLSAHGVTMLMMCGHFTVYVFLAAYAEQVLGLSAREASAMYLVFGLAGMTGGWLGGSGSDRWGGPRAAAGAGLALLLALALLPLVADNVALAAALVLLWAMSAWGSTPAVQHYIASSAPESVGIQLGLNLAALNFGLAAGAALGGAVLNWAPLRLLPWTGALAVGLALLTLRYSANRQRAR